MIATVLMVLDVLVCIALIASVLMQSGKGSGLSDAFGGGGGGGAFFGKGNDVDTLMAKVTIGLGTAFGIITLAIAKISG
ncbi:preprotein translocase subunit SecG [Phascolarctobacterium sp.]|uniref:preprotein translocase subunit SecG n=1 Tax=Phascolarctobacterium sp. TaxID=2049039 RepID=UPI0025CEDE80|nr:preprotein translocase subunit SecG [uncultured Phascolarctobacterium sp.]